jgi:hypothetical protein
MPHVQPVHGRHCNCKSPGCQSSFAAPCTHLHDSTTRYDHDKKVLTFLLFCPVCRTEKVIDALPYEPRFEPHAAGVSRGATIHELPVRPGERPMPRAA